MPSFLPPPNWAGNVPLPPTPGQVVQWAGDVMTSAEQGVSNVVNNIVDKVQEATQNIRRNERTEIRDDAGRRAEIEGVVGRKEFETFAEAVTEGFKRIRDEIGALRLSGGNRQVWPGTFGGSSGGGMFGGQGGGMNDIVMLSLLGILDLGSSGGSALSSNTLLLLMLAGGGGGGGGLGSDPLTTVLLLNSLSA